MRISKFTVIGLLLFSNLTTGNEYYSIYENYGNAICKNINQEIGNMHINAALSRDVVNKLDIVIPQITRVQAKETLRKYPSPGKQIYIYELDITNDGIPELITEALFARMTYSFIDFLWVLPEDTHEYYQKGSESIEKYLNQKYVFSSSYGFKDISPLLPTTLELTYNKNPKSCSKYDLEYSQLYKFTFKDKLYFATAWNKEFPFVLISEVTSANTNYEHLPVCLLVRKSINHIFEHQGCKIDNISPSYYKYTWPNKASQQDL